MSSTTLQGALEALYGLERRRDKLGLDGTRALLAGLGDPQRRFRSVHVAGTNGKGSTCAMIERGLRDAGVRTGLFTSPHLVDFRERIRVNGRWADEEGLHAVLRRIEALPYGAPPAGPGAAPAPTFFEVATALGFAWFARERVAWAVVEVGLGGRLDTTNVLEPEACVITSIALDHTEILGDTIEAVAREKAGIVKPGVPVVVAPDVDPRARVVIANAARDAGAPVIAVTGEGGGDYRDANAATATAVLRLLAARGVPLTDAAIASGIRDARWPGRCERAPGAPRLWWDGAHNPAGVAALARAWRARGLAAPAAVVLALSRDKDLPAMLAALGSFVPAAILVATRSGSERALAPESIADAATACGWRARVERDVAAACAAALAAAAPDGLVLLVGSLFAVGDAMRVYGGAPGEVL